MKSSSDGIQSALERVVGYLSDGSKWRWMDMASRRDSADKALKVLADEKLIEQCEHPSGGKVWRTSGKLFGRTDGMSHEKFDEILARNKS